MGGLNEDWSVSWLKDWLLHSMGVELWQAGLVVLFIVLVLMTTIEIVDRVVICGKDVAPGKGPTLKR